MNYKAFWKTLIVLSCCLILLDVTVGKSLKYLYFQQKNGKSHSLTVGLKQQQSDILIFGSSRAMHHYDPDIISDSLQMTCYNIGYDGQSILYHNAVLDVVMERYNPKIIILDILSEELYESTQSYDLLSVLNPYVSDYPVLWNTLSLISPYEKVKHLSSIYPYNSTLLRTIAGNIERGGKDITLNGFTPQEGIWKFPLKQRTFQVDKDFDPNKLKAFELFCRKCIENEIDLYIIVSPIFVDVQEQSSSTHYIIEKCNAQAIPFISFVNDGNYRSNELFLDESHLNTAGSAVFSKEMSYRIAAKVKN